MMQPQEVRLFARYEDGGFPVVCKDREYVIQRPEGSAVYSTRRQVVRDLTGHPKGRNWTWDRYFRLGKFQTPGARAEAQALGNVFDLFAPVVEPVITVIVPKGIGIDLAKRGHEVRKLLFAGFGGKIKAAGYDPEDVLQEVYKGILVRNNGKCPFNPAKASFGHYVHMVCDCIVSNYHRRMSRQRRVEPIADENDELALEMAEGGATPESDEMVVADFITSIEEGLDDTDLLRQVLPLVRAGYGRSEIAEKLNLPKTLISKALGTLRDEARFWNR